MRHLRSLISTGPDRKREGNITKWRYTRQNHNCSPSPSKTLQKPTKTTHSATRFRVIHVLSPTYLIFRKHNPIRMPFFYFIFCVVSFEKVRFMSNHVKVKSTLSVREYAHFATRARSHSWRNVALTLDTPQQVTIRRANTSRRIPHALVASNHQWPETIKQHGPIKSAAFPRCAGCSWSSCTTRCHRQSTSTQKDSPAHLIGTYPRTVRYSTVPKETLRRRRAAGRVRDLTIILPSRGSLRNADHTVNNS